MIGLYIVLALWVLAREPMIPEVHGLLHPWAPWFLLLFIVFIVGVTVAQCLDPNGTVSIAAQHRAVKKYIKRESNDYEKEVLRQTRDRSIVPLFHDVRLEAAANRLVAIGALEQTEITVRGPHNRAWIMTGWVVRYLRKHPEVLEPR